MNRYPAVLICKLPNGDEFARVPLDRRLYNRLHKAAADSSLSIPELVSAAVEAKCARAGLRPPSKRRSA